jgi:hypothetical protein
MNGSTEGSHAHHTNTIGYGVMQIVRSVGLLLLLIAT